MCNMSVFWSDVIKRTRATVFPCKVAMYLADACLLKRTTIAFVCTVILGDYSLCRHHKLGEGQNSTHYSQCYLSYCQRREIFLYIICHKRQSVRFAAAALEGHHYWSGMLFCFGYRHMHQLRAQCIE